MSDMRFVLVGMGLVFAGFIVLGIFGGHFFSVTVEAQEFKDCYEYREDGKIPVPCDVALQYKAAFFAMVVGLIAAGVFALIRGARGDWDQKKHKDIS